MKTDKEIFEVYKKRLVSESNGKNIRFNVIQYLCGFPKINPVAMASSLLHDGNIIAFDDSSISISQNEVYRKSVQKYQ